MSLYLPPLVSTIGISILNELIDAFNSISGITIQKELEGQRLAYQKELQEKQIIAQLETEYIRYLYQIKLQENNQEFQMNLEDKHQEFKTKIFEYQCKNNQKLQEFIQVADMQITRSKQEFKTWLFQQEKQLQIELCKLNLEAQYFNTLCQRETAVQMKELDNWPLKNSALQILQSNQGCNPIPIQIILVPPQINFHRFEHLDKRPNSTFSNVEENISQYLKSFLEKYYPLENKERPTKLISNTWKSNYFAGYSAVTTIFNHLKSEPTLLIESTVNGEFINIQVAYWSGGQEIFPFYKTIVFKLNYPITLHEFAIKRALNWENNIKRKLLAKGKKEQEINQRFGEGNVDNLSTYKEYKELQEEGIEIKTSYKISNEDFDNFLGLLGIYHKIISGLFTDLHYLICTNLSPKLPKLFLELEKEFLIEQNLANDLFTMVIENYIDTLRTMAKYRSELVANIAADIAINLINLSDSKLAEIMLDFSLESWLSSRYISIKKNRDKIDIVAENLLPLDQDFVDKINSYLFRSGQRELNIIESCYSRGIKNFNLKKYQQAIIDFSYVIDLKPQSIDIYYQRGLAYFELEDYLGAVNDLTQVIELDASYTQVYKSRGYAYYKLGKYQQALDDYNQAINLGWIEALEHRDIVLDVLEEIKSKRQTEKKIRLEKELSKGELFNFEVVMVNNSGKIIARSQESARQNIENLGNTIKLEMVYISGSTFTMGFPQDEKGSRDRERPQHDVSVPHFFMGKYPVTQGQWKAIASQINLKVELDLDPEPSRFKEPYKGKDRWQRPVESVNWYEAVEFCERLSRLTGKKYRLPSEAEWEYACRAGTTTPFYFGETITPELVNYDGNYTYGDGPEGVYREQTTPVGQFPPNIFGLYDMHGNVWEWCADDWHNNYVGAPIDGSAWVDSSKKDSTGSNSILRGGSWGSSPNVCRSAYRGNDYRRDNLGINFGFRVVCNSERTAL
ncbi:MAG: SUMF1/EgtB/PvdO family nonheme iron enzyme [Trichodesmium sp. MAG_R04]|nr:SUMF1/EgtB/PvdO family nonheme iron enzyme [Trichodesmium sp. MAG_R04]